MFLTAPLWLKAVGQFLWSIRYLIVAAGVALALWWLYNYIYNSGYKTAKSECRQAEVQATLDLRDKEITGLKGQVAANQRIIDQLRASKDARKDSFDKANEELNSHAESPAVCDLGPDDLRVLQSTRFIGRESRTVDSVHSGSRVNEVLPVPGNSP